MSITRRQALTGALAVAASMAVPDLVASGALEPPFRLDFPSSRWLTDIAEMHAEFSWCERNFDDNQYARDTWWLSHNDLAMNADLMRKVYFDDPDERRLVLAWLDTLYPRPTLRAWRVLPPLRGLSTPFNALQSELDDVTAELGEASRRQEQSRRTHAAPWPLIWMPDKAVSKLLRKQHEIAGQFVHLTVASREDRLALRRAADTYGGPHWVCAANARRGRRLLQLRGTIAR